MAIPSEEGFKRLSPEIRRRLRSRHHDSWNSRKRSRPLYPCRGRHRTITNTLYITIYHSQSRLITQKHVSHTTRHRSGLQVNFERIRTQQTSKPNDSMRIRPPFPPRTPRKNMVVVVGTDRKKHNERPLFITSRTGSRLRSRHS